MLAAVTPSTLAPLAEKGSTYLYAGITVLLLLVVAYPDRMVGTKTRKGIHNVTPGYPLVGNITWILGIITQRTRLLDEIYRLQKEQGKGGMPFTLTFPALGGRVTVINNPAYIQHVQKVSDISVIIILAISSFSPRLIRNYFHPFPHPPSRLFVVI